MPQVQLSPIPQGPENPQTRYEAPSGISDAFNKLGDIGNQIANQTTALAAEKQATVDQQGAGNKSVAIDDTSFPSIYAEAYNKTANLIFGATKKSQLDAGLSQLYVDNATDPTKFAAAANDYKAQYMQNVPALQQAAFGADFDQAVAAKATQVFQNNTDLTRSSALAAGTARLSQLNNSIYQSALANGGDGVDMPQTASAIAERKAILLNLTDPTNLGGPLMSADQAAKEDIVDRANQREGELLHDFTHTPYPQQAKFVTDLEQHGDQGSDALGGQQFGMLIGRMKQEYNFSRAGHDADMLQTRYDVESAIQDLNQGNTPAGMDVLWQRVNASGDPVMTQRLNRAVNVNAAVKDFGTLPLDQMGLRIDADRAKIGQPGASLADDSTASQVLHSEQDIYAKAQTELATDPLGFAVDHRAAPAASLAPLNLNDPNSVQARMDGVRKTEAQYHVPVSPLRPEDVRAIAAQWPSQSPDQQITTIKGLNGLNMTPEESALVYRALDKENPALSTVAEMLKTPNTASLAHDALDGLDYFKNNKDVVDKDGTVQREIDGKLSSLYQLDPAGQSLQATSPLALGLYVKNAARSGTFTVPTAYDATTAADTAVANLFGYKSLSEMPTINGKSVIPFAPGMSSDTHTGIWSSLTDDDLKAMNGGQLPTDNFGGKKTPISAQQIVSKSFPIYTGIPGLYQVGQTGPDGNVFTLRNASGAPFIFNADTQAATFKQRGALSGTIRPGELGGMFQP